MVQSHLGLKIAPNSPDVFKYISKKVIYKTHHFVYKTLILINDPSNVMKKFT